MSEGRRLDLDGARAYAAAVLEHFNTSPANAAVVAEALVAAESDGLPSHGLARLPSYGLQAMSGKIDGHATPSVRKAAPSVVAVDAANGFAYPAVRLAEEQLVPLAKEMGIAIAGIRRSSHFGVAGHPVERMAQHGLIALAFTNAPASIAPWGGRRPVFGTNPIAFATPLLDRPPVVVDLSVSKVARGHILAAAQKGEPIPEGWALDKDGQATTDAKAGLAGTMVPMGEAKGTALAFMVEVLSAAINAATFAIDAPSFFDGEGPSPAIGQTLVAIDPGPMAGPGYLDHLARLVEAIEGQDGARIPGSRRIAARARVASAGVLVSAALERELAKLGFAPQV
ncbi:Ldh family oxidoreductase [Xanthobacter sp. DSM 24535]|uniref:Ldh family oxidoreductase n=1 Tax=Roseixanthobacter psychrophilus TaxID=3119917 RepID=UPI0037272C7F